jgi:hypothetical protein
LCIWFPCIATAAITGKVVIGIAVEIVEVIVVDG